MEKNYEKNNKPKVLVIEDDKFILSVHENKLTKEGFELYTAMNGTEGLKIAVEKKPDIILLDLIMPIKDGFETLKELKNDPELKNTKVVILSNLSQDEDKKRAMDMGAVDYIVKANVSFHEIIDLIKRNLGVPQK